MGTKFSEINDYFLSQVDDYELSQLDEEEIHIYLEKFLITGLLNVQRFIKNAFDLDKEKKCFNRELSLQEQILISKSMKLMWISEKKNNLELMRRNIGDRDFKSVQGTEYLKELSKMEESLKKEIDQNIVDYSYSDSSYWNGLR